MKDSNELSHIGILGMKWGHRSGSSSKGQGRKLPKQVSGTKSGLKKNVEQELVSKLAHKNLSDVDRAELNRGRTFKEQEKLSTAFQKKYTPQHFMANTAIVHLALTNIALNVTAIAASVGLSAIAGAKIALGTAAAVAPYAGLALLASDKEGTSL